MNLQSLVEDLVIKKIPHKVKNGKVYFSGSLNKVKFVRYVYEKRDTLELDVYVCIDKPFGEEQTTEDRKVSAREKNRWIRDEFNTWDISHKFEEWKPQSQAVTPPEASLEATSVATPKVLQSDQEPQAQGSTGSSDDFDWSFVDTSESTDDDPFSKHSN